MYRCSCGEAGCGVTAPYIVGSPDRSRISWVDFRDYVGVFAGPLAPGSADHEGRPCEPLDFHFDRAQYLAEVRQATADRSWETLRRQTARLPEEKLRPVLPTLDWVSPAWRAEGVEISLQGPDCTQQLLHLTSPALTSAETATDMAHPTTTHSTHHPASSVHLGGIMSPDPAGLHAAAISGSPEPSPPPGTWQPHDLVQSGHDI
jgi:hypothetical protein